MATVCFLPSIIFWKYEIFDLDEVRDGESDGSVLLAKCFESRSQVGPGAPAKPQDRFIETVRKLSKKEDLSVT